jgi:hypothetical protein
MSDGRTRLWVALFIVLVFVCGLSVGMALGPRLSPGLGPWMSPWMGPWTGGPMGAEASRDRFRRPPRPGGPGGRGAFVSERILDRLREDPSFTDEQHEQLTALFADREDRFRKFNRDMRQRFESERTRLRDDISAVLSPEQMEIFDNTRRRGRRWRRPDSDDRGR